MRLLAIPFILLLFCGFSDPCDPFELEQHLNFHISEPMFNCQDRANLAVTRLNRCPEIDYAYPAIERNFNTPYGHKYVKYKYKTGKTGRIF